MKIKIALITGMLLNGCLFGVGIAAEQQVVPKDVDSVVVQTSPVQEEAIDPTVINEVQKDVEFVSSSKMTTKAIDEFVELHGIEFGIENGKGQTFYSATETVAVDETNPQWAKWRVIAYNKAYLKIKQQFLEETFGKVAGEILLEYLKDESDGRLDFPLPEDPRAYTKTEEIWDKLIALTGGKLNKALEDLGIDPERFKAAPPEQRKKLFKDNFMEKSITRAAGSLGGLIPIKTFEGFDSKGNYTIGVISMYYDKLKQLAYDIVKKRTPMLSKKTGNPIRSYVPKTDKNLSQAFGVRLVFNETGSPLLISYGQWSYVYKGKDQRKLDRSYDYALKKAKAESKNQIAKFLNSTASYEEINYKAAQNETIAIKDRDSNIRTEDITNLADKLESTMKQRYSADLRGMKTYKKWSYKYPNGHEIVGVVTIWTQKDAERVDNIRNWKPKHQQQSATKPALQKKASKSGLHEGVGMDTDF